MTTWPESRLSARDRGRGASHRVRRTPASRPRKGVRRVFLLLLALVIVAAAAAVIWVTLPRWYPGWMPAEVGKAAFPLDHTAAIREAAARRDLDPALVAAVIYTESGFETHVQSSSGAIGLMQIMPTTAAEIARKTDGYTFEQADLKTARLNILYGCYLLRVLLDRYDGALIESLAAYNAGPGRVDAWIAERGGGALRIADIPFAETRAYVKKVLHHQRVYRDVYGAELGS